MAQVRSIVTRHPLGTSVIAMVVAALLAVVLYWFQPQALVIDERVDEALPRASDPVAPGEDESTDPASPSDNDTAPDAAVLASGRFRSLDHAASGRAALLALDDGSRYVRFEDFEVQNGPDLRIYLSKAPGDASTGFAADFVDLGVLKGNIGNQNYKVPSDVDLDDYRSVVVWCRRFSVGFAVAPLEI